MSEPPTIPPDLAALGWHWNDRGFLESADRLVAITFGVPRCFDEARIMVEVGARLEAMRKPKQMELDL